jgi:hypothetical protein
MLVDTEIYIDCPYRYWRVAQVPGRRSGYGVLLLRQSHWPVYEFVRVRSRRALVTACPSPSLLK